MKAGIKKVRRRTTMTTTIRQWATGDWCVYTAVGTTSARRVIKTVQGERSWSAVLQLMALKQRENEAEVLRKLMQRVVGAASKQATETT